MKRLVLATALVLAACATGTTLVTGHARAATTPDAVQVYLAPPAGQYDVIGAVESTSALGITAQQNLDIALADIKKRAAGMGANGVIIDYMGAPGGRSPVIGTVSGGVVTLIPTSDGGDREVRGRAVYVSP